jgi:hypothetical protein
MVVRSMVCAFVPSDYNASSKSEDDDLDDVINAVSSLYVAYDDDDKKKRQVTDVKGTALKVVHGSAIVPQESIVKVATISIHRESQMNWEEKGPFLVQGPLLNDLKGSSNSPMFILQNPFIFKILSLG